MFQPKALCENLTPSEMRTAALQGVLEIQKDLLRIIKSPQVKASYQDKLTKIIFSNQSQQVSVPLDKKSDWTPLMLAVLYNNQLTDLNKKLGMPAYLFLLEQGADVNESNIFQMTPLMITAFTGDVTVAHELIQRGAQIDSVNYHDETAAHLAFQEGKNDLLQLLIDKGTDTALRSYSELCLEDREIKEILKERGISLKKATPSSGASKKTPFDSKSHSY